MIKPNSKLALDSTQKYDIKELKQEHHPTGIAFGRGRLFFNADGEICYAIPNLEKEETDILDAQYKKSATLVQQGFHVLNYRCCYNDGNEIIFVFCRHESIIPIHNHAKCPFAALMLLSSILVEVQKCKQISLSVDTVFLDARNSQVWILPIAEADYEECSDPELIYQAAKLALLGEAQFDERNIKPYDEYPGIIVRCLSAYPSQRYQTVSECLKAIRQELDGHVEAAPNEKESSFLEDMNAFFSKLKSIRFPKLSFALEERETKAQLNETYKETETFSRLPHLDNSTKTE